MCFPCFNWFEGIVCIFRYIAIIVFKYIFIEINIYIFEIAYPVHAFCNSPQLVLIGDSFNFGFWTHVRWVSYYLPKLRSSKWKWCLLDQLRSSLPALGRLIREDRLRGYFCQSCWYCMILENDPSSKETCWFVVIPVGSIPTQHKSVYATSRYNTTHLSQA